MDRWLDGAPIGLGSSDVGGFTHWLDGAPVTDSDLTASEDSSAAAAASASVGGGAVWTLRLGATERSLADWGISGVRRQRRSQASDELTFQLDGRAFERQAPFDAGDAITVLRGGVPWFTGRVVALARGASGSSESIGYRVAGPWWFLDQLVYQQVWHVYHGPDVRKSHCLLNIWADGSLMGVRDQLNEALQWAHDRAVARYGASPFVWDRAEFPDASIPTDEVRDITTAEVVRKQLRWVPDAVTWFDYSTTPPTFHCRRRSALALNTLSGPSARVTEIRLTPRYDLVVPSVVLKYERVDTIDGVSIPSLSTDVAPAGSDGTEFGALAATIDLQGFSATFAEARITTNPLPALTGTEQNKKDWWAWLQSKEPWLQSTDVSLLSVDAVNRMPSAGSLQYLLPNELADGQIPDWMGALTQQETVTVIARIGVGNGGELIDVVTKTFTVNIVTTDANTGTYRQAQSVEGGEYAPVGLAQVLYDGLSVLEWEGGITCTRDEIQADGAGFGMGQRVNVTGWMSAWATMAAMVQESVDDLDTGTTSIRCGPPNHLGPRDLIELLRVNRFRFVYTPKSVRAGKSSSAGGVGLGRSVRLENASSGSGAREKMVLRSGAGTINLDAGMAGNTEIAVREIDVCVNGVAMKMLVLASTPY